VNLKEQNEHLVQKNKRLKEQITNLQATLKQRNLELDAIGRVWCDGGCHGGVFRFSDQNLTEEMVRIAERNTKRLRNWFENNRFTFQYNNNNWARWRADRRWEYIEEKRKDRSSG